MAAGNPARAPANPLRDIAALAFSFRSQLLCPDRMSECFRHSSRIIWAKRGRPTRPFCKSPIMSAENRTDVKLLLIAPQPDESGGRAGGRVRTCRPLGGRHPSAEE